MFATDFMFNGQRASDFGLIICSFDGDFSVASGGDIEFNVVKAPNRDRYTFYGAEFNNTLEWEFSIMKNTCYKEYDQNPFFNYGEERMVSKWLLKTDGYHWFRFINDEDDEIYYKVYINITPHQIMGKTVGFDLIVTADCAYGFTDKIKKRFQIDKDNSYDLYIDTDISTYLLPKVKIIGAGDFFISNDSDILQNQETGKASEFKNVSDTIILDSDNDIVKGLEPNDFNWYFLRLIDGKNVFSTDSANQIDIELTYREARRVII